MKIKTIISMASTCFILSSEALCQNVPNDMRLMLKRIANIQDHFIIESSIELKNEKRKIRIVHPVAHLGEENVVDDYRMILRRKKNGKFIRVDVAGILEGVPSYDTVNLTKNIPIRDKIFIEIFYNLKPGDYRMNVVQKVFEEQKEIFISSNWFYFRYDKKPKKT